MIPEQAFDLSIVADLMVIKSALKYVQNKQIKLQFTIVIIKYLTVGKEAITKHKNLILFYVNYIQFSKITCSQESTRKNKTDSLVLIVDS